MRPACKESNRGCVPRGELTLARESRLQHGGLHENARKIREIERESKDNIPRPSHENYIQTRDDLVYLQTCACQEERERECVCVVCEREREREEKDLKTIECERDKADLRNECNTSIWNCQV